MAITFSYPGVYIQEFTPGVPIQGVGTSTAAFIGTAASGPINVPTKITSWDEFQNIFGGFLSSGPISYLPAAVYGFFLNGGTTCYILRASNTGASADSDLLTRAPSAGQNDLVATAIQEGVAGNSISAQIVDSSRLASQLAAAGAGTTTLTVAQASTTIAGFDSTGTTMTVGSNNGFVAGDRIQLSKGGPAVTAIITSTQGTTTILLAAPVSGTAGLVGGTARTDDLRPGDLTFRVVVPNGLVLSQALPAGALISITLGATTEDVTVASAGGNTITLATGLANTYSLAGSPFPQVASLEFDLIVTNSATGKSETWPQLSMNPLHPGYWRTVVQSNLITLSLPPSPPTGPLPDPRPAPAIYNLAGGKDDNRATDLSDIIANPNKYLDLLKPLPDADIIAIPGVTAANPQQALVAHCELMFNRFAVLDGPDTDSVGFPSLLTQYGQVRTSNGFAALYFPWMQVVNPMTGLTEFWPPSGHVIGIYAQVDQSRGVYKAPANVVIAGSLGLKYVLTDADQGPLNLLGIDILRTFRERTQPLVWGARTTSTDSSWQYVNIRRSFIFYEQSILQAMQGVLFEVNNPLLWGRLKRSITEFLNRVKGDGGIIDFYVRIDAALNPPATQALGQLFVEIGIQPAYPAEFIVLRIGIWQGGSSITEQ
jgi:phage tail sheath protein FI